MGNRPALSTSRKLRSSSVEIQRTNEDQTKAFHGRRLGPAGTRLWLRQRQAVGAQRVGGLHHAPGSQPACRWVHGTHLVFPGGCVGRARRGRGRMRLQLAGSTGHTNLMNRTAFIPAIILLLVSERARADEGFSVTPQVARGSNAIWELRI